MIKWAWIGIIIAALVGVFAFFKAHKKFGSVLLIGALAGSSIVIYTDRKTEMLNNAVLSEYNAITRYNALYESTRDNIYKEIAKDEMLHYKYLTGYGYTAVGNVPDYPLSLEGAIQSKQDAIKIYEDILDYIAFDDTLKSDVQRILQDEKEHLSALIEFSIQEKERSRISLDLVSLMARIRELPANVHSRIRNITENIRGDRI
jgi:rubrerythrin